MTGQLARFLVVGASNTAITLASYALLVAAGVPAVAASVAAFAAGAANGFRLNRAWTFRSRRGGARTVARYVAVLGLGLGLNALGVALAVGVLGLPRHAGELAALPPVTATTFVLVRCWVFGAGRGGTAARRAAAPPAR
jgi:putative flippase GtrA